MVTSAVGQQCGVVPFTPPQLAGLAANQHGLVRRGQALDHGVDPRVMVRARRWVPVRRGVYATADHWESLDVYRGRPRLRTRAALMQMERSWVLSHESAALEHGLPLLDPHRAPVGVTRPGITSAWTRHGVGHHLARYLPEQVVRVDGLPTLDVPRTVVDLARSRGLLAGVIAADAALARGVPRSALAAAYEPMTSWPGVTSARAAVDFADPGAETPHESLARILLSELGLGPIDTQFPVQTPRGVVWCDLRIGNQVYEADGAWKYRSVHAGGLRVAEPDDALWDEKVRERLIRDVGLGASRIFWQDHWGERRRQALERLWRDTADTVALRGTELPAHLARDAERIRREQRRVRHLGA